MWANAKPGRITIGRRDRFWVLSIKQPGDRWAEIIGIFRSQKSAQAEIDAYFKNDPDLGRPWVMRVHEPSYVNRVRTAFEDRVRALDAGDTVVRSDTYETALQSVGGALSMLRAVSSGEVDNGFAALRPPGHHAASCAASSARANPTTTPPLSMSTIASSRHPVSPLLAEMGGVDAP